MRSERGRLAIVLAAGIGLSATSACDHFTGPGLTVAVDSEALTPSASVPEARTICCCHVKGFVRNTTTIPVYVRLSWQGTHANGLPVSSAALDTVKDLAPGERRAFLGIGFEEPCAGISAIVRTTEVKGLLLPSPPP